MERIQENAQLFSFLQATTDGEESTTFLKETIYNIVSVLRKNMINKVLPSPQHADYIDLLGDRRPSYYTALKMFTLTDKKKNAEST